MTSVPSATDPPDPVAAAVVAALSARRETVAAAESLTAGLVCATLTCVPGSSAVLRGGLVVYASDLKTSLAGVDGALLARLGPVHPEVAAALAEGARTRCGADWGLGLTGVAGPGPQDGVPAGTVHVSLAGPGGDHPARTGRTLRIDGDRQAVRAASVAAALALLREQLG
ncbi:damage-inducible protein [Amycolatopsis antarctica]|uniref:Damage-inducible protein n=1 Tax=Amycolatopsis antarctica TaxID=1854586 RepID=A0A263D7K9_9PSEU|nr:nicotinamide-nucleotide amidohydrolase family protein [Amycolatopsis antarctica]OZM74413.1 damage-inducible protein [Amycolatopsis antarctica]